MHENKKLLSIVLLDWSVRESFHTLDFLNEQTVPRKDYEIIWVEYYSRRPEEIRKKLKECKRLNKPPVIDKWIVMDMPDNIYYHKHLMYNVGIIASEGKIICFCDSDAAFRPTFVESIVKSFNENQNIVLHMDQIRSIEKRFYPFNYPSFAEIANPSYANIREGKPEGLIDNSSPLQIPNYGACMCALREDLIAIGGADEHIAYLGHICGPYEMTFRFINLGKKEIWHQTEWLYHTWHPGQAGSLDVFGSHDGRNMAQAALSARKTGRILPLLENPAIRKLRKGEKKSFESLYSTVISLENRGNWMVGQLKPGKPKIGSNSMKKWKREKSFILILIYYRFKIALSYLYAKLPNIKRVFKNFFIRSKETLKESASSNNSFPTETRKIRIKNFISRFNSPFQHSDYIINRCWQCLYDLTVINVKEIAVYGTGDVAKVFCIILNKTPIKIAGVYDDSKKNRFMGYKVLPLKSLKDYNGKVVIASFDNVVKKTEKLKDLGLKNNMIVDLY